MTDQETRRQVVHVAMGLFAPALRWLTWWQAAACAGAALLFNLILLPRLARTLFRRSELEAGRFGGIVFYPLAVLLLVVAFPDRPDIAALAWGVLAAGDGFATLVGRAVGRRRLPWNREKTWAGSLAFVMAGGIAGTALAWWTRPAVAATVPPWFTWGAPWLAACVAALVETIPVRLDDNLSVPAAAGVTAWVISLADPVTVAARLPLIEDRLLPALAVNSAAAAAGFLAGTVTWTGMAAGWIVGIVVWLGCGPAGWGLLFASFLSAAAASRVGLQRKMVLGIAEARGGRRGPWNTIANCGVAAVAAGLALARPDPSMPLLVFVAALVAGASDTVASEVGKAYGRTTILITTLRRVPPGISGAVSVEGTAAGLAAAVALAGGAALGGLLPAAWVWIVVAGSAAGSLVESALGASLEGPGILNNDLLNVLNTAAAALAAVVLARSVT
jgi:uncharacterized protein (TIGR00297 family)